MDTGTRVWPYFPEYECSWFGANRADKCEVPRLMKELHKTTLVNEFLRDHQRFISLLRDVVVFVERGEIATARSLADELDRLAGPHIEFEEKILYPTTIAAHGVLLERKLLAEHGNFRAGLKQLLSASDARLSRPEFQQRVAAALRGGLKHAESCGLLVSHLDQLTELEQQQALTKLNGLKREGRRWTAAAE